MSTNACNTDQMALPQKGEEIAVIKTKFGTMKARLFDCNTPKTVQNFKGLANKGFYNGLIFHRIIKGFMIQGGDPKGLGIGGETFDGKPLIPEFDTGIKHVKGTLSMARTADPMSATSQFFIVQNAPHLDGDYAAFGQVFEGLEVLDQIANVKTGAGDRPLEEVAMETISIEKFQ